MIRLFKILIIIACQSLLKLKKICKLTLHLHAKLRSLSLFWSNLNFVECFPKLNFNNVGSSKQFFQTFELDDRQKQNAIFGYSLQRTCSHAPGMGWRQEDGYKIWYKVVIVSEKTLELTERVRIRNLSRRGKRSKHSFPWGF